MPNLCEAQELGANWLGEANGHIREGFATTSEHCLRLTNQATYVRICISFRRKECALAHHHLGALRNIILKDAIWFGGTRQHNQRDNCPLRHPIQLFRGISAMRPIQPLHVRVHNSSLLVTLLTCPARIFSAAVVIAWLALMQAMVTVCAGTPFGTPLLIAASRAMLEVRQS